MRKHSVWKRYSLQITEMRRSGYTLREIGDSVGVTRERIRQLLQQHHVNVDILLLSEKRMAKVIGCPVGRIVKLREQGIINSRNHGKRSHYYDTGELEKAKLALQRHCLHCGQPLTMNYIGKYCYKCRVGLRGRNYPFLSQQGRRTQQED
jgi:hypothetical protein